MRITRTALVRGFLLLLTAAGLGGCLYGPYPGHHHSAVVVTKPAPSYYYAAPKRHHHGHHYWGHQDHRKRWRHW